MRRSCLPLSRAPVSVFWMRAVERDILLDYFAARGIAQHFLVDGLTSPAEIVSWVYPLEFYARAFGDAGFATIEPSEPRPTRTQLESDPWWSKNFPHPLFLLVVAERR
jgi:hypothetical protein